MGIPGPHFPGKLGTPLGKWGSPASSTTRLYCNCSISKSWCVYIEPVLQWWEKASSITFH